MRHRDERAGFTLIEALAALAITAALIGTAMPFAVRLATHWWVGERTVENADGWMQGLARLGDDLAEAVPIKLPGAGPNAVVAFSASPDSVQFVRPALGTASASELETVRFDVRHGADGDRLVRQATRFAAESFSHPDFGDGVGTTILDGPFRLQIATVGKDLTARSLWTPEPRMPAGVRLSATAMTAEPVPPAPILLPIVAQSPEPEAVPQPGTTLSPSSD